ncbi:MAG TPA: murein biosynthesis integral membrane protein MurJ [Actinomycetota bacterium]
MGKEVLAADDIVTGGPPAEGPPPPGSQPEGLVRSTALMSVGTTLSRVTGFGRVAAMTFAIGVAESRLADVYNVANNMPNIIYELVLGGVLSSVFVPVFVEQIASRTKDEAWHVARAVMTVTMVLLGTVMVIGIVAAPWIVRLYTFRVEAEAQAAAEALGTLFLQLFMPQIVLYGIGAAATGLLNAHRRFVVPMFAPILNNIVVIASFLVFAWMYASAQPPTPGNITLAQKLVLSVGTTAGVLAMTVALWPSLRRIGFRWRWALDFRHPAIRKLIRLSGWAVGYVIVNQIGLLIVIALAARDQGAYTAYQAAFIFFQLPHAIFSVSIMTALLPSMSERWVGGDRTGFRRILARGVRASAFIVVPAAAGYMVLARPIVRLLLEHGVTTAESTELLAGVLTYFALGLFSFSAFMLFLRGFYAMQDTRTPMLVNIFAVSLHTGVNFILFPLMGVEGLALGHAAAYTFAAIVSAVILRRRLGGLEGGSLLAGLGKVVAAAGLTAAASWGAARLAARAFGVDTLTDQIIQVGVGVLAGLIIFIVAALLFRMEELHLLKRAFLRRR